MNLVQKINVDNQLISEEKQDNSIFYRPILDTTAFMMPMVNEWIEDVKELYEETTSTP